MREQLTAIVTANPLWDGRALVLQVVDSSATAMMVRALVSAADGRSAWDLRCDVREALLGWLAAAHPGALPQLRTADVTARAEPVTQPIARRAGDAGDEVPARHLATPLPDSPAG